MRSFDDLPARIRAKISVGGPDECWPWTAARGANGYAHATWEGRVHEVHRLIYRLLVGEPAGGDVVDHDCHNGSGCAGGPSCPHRRCCNPTHLVARTRGANVLAGSGPSAVNARKDVCANGHPYTPDTLKVEVSGSRRCLLCRREVDRRRYQRRVATSHD